VVSDEMSDVRFCRQGEVMNTREVCACFSCCVDFFMMIFDAAAKVSAPALSNATVRSATRVSSALEAFNGGNACFSPLL